MKKKSGAGKGPDFRIAAQGKKWSNFRPAANSSRSAILHLCVQTVVQPVSVYLNRTPVFEQVEPQFNYKNNNLSPSLVKIQIGPLTGNLSQPFLNNLDKKPVPLLQAISMAGSQIQYPSFNLPPG
ncbi:MAG: hypothetical protein KG003_09365 [Bacteroidetes bacterium]|nr:hypothetical protein [Bacteroidota bacterium]